jgi:hypothetical protein
LRRERDIIARNEDIALRAALADIARWNHEWREGQKTCRERREQISEELAIVNKLLLMQKRKSGRRSTLRVKSKRKAGAANEMVAQTADANYAFGKVPKFAVVPFVATVTSVFLTAFEHIAETRDPSVLTKAGFGSFVSVAIVLHVKYLSEFQSRSKSG